MDTSFLFNFSATAQLVFNPYTDTVIAANQEACLLLRSDAESIKKQPLSRLFRESFPSLLCFTQELQENTRAWTDTLLITSSYDTIPVEVQGRLSQAGEQHFVHFSVYESESIRAYREKSEVEAHYRSGIGHWNRVSRVFQEFERENQLLLDAAGEGIYGVDMNGITTFVNPAAENILGYKAEELAWRNMHSMVHYSHADGSHFHSEDCPIFSAFRDGTVKKVDDDIFWTKNGTPINVEYTSTPIHDNGFIIGAVVIFRDTTQKKSDKKKLIDALNEVKKLKTRLEFENAYFQEEIDSEFNHHKIIGKSSAIQEVIKQIELVAPTESTVLISGESGTGKELIARAIHETSPRSNRPLIRVNCAAIPKDLFESEFFGHKKGAFTGATHDRPGRFELADGGTLFLDEVGEIPLELQGKLLRVLQEQQFERVGDSITRHVNVRIITATNKDLKTQSDTGEFREDLYYRLNVFPITSIPLRDRKEDIPLLTQHFLDKACKKINKSLKIPLSEMSKFTDYMWPGNIRELENFIERRVILAQGNKLMFDNTPTGVAIEINNDSSTKDKVLTDHELKLFEKQNIINALTLAKGTIFGVHGAARLLDLKPTTLTSKLKKYDIDATTFK